MLGSAENQRGLPFLRSRLAVAVEAFKVGNLCNEKLVPGVAGITGKDDWRANVVG